MSSKMDMHFIHGLQAIALLSARSGHLHLSCSAQYMPTFRKLHPCNVFFLQGTTVERCAAQMPSLFGRIHLRLCQFGRLCSPGCSEGQSSGHLCHLRSVEPLPAELSQCLLLTGLSQTRPMLQNSMHCCMHSEDRGPKHTSFADKQRPSENRLSEECRIEGSLFRA